MFDKSHKKISVSNGYLTTLAFQYAPARLPDVRAKAEAEELVFIGLTTGEYIKSLLVLIYINYIIYCLFKSFTNLVNLNHVSKLLDHMFNFLPIIISGT